MQELRVIHPARWQASVANEMYWPAIATNKCLAWPRALIWFNTFSTSQKSPPAIAATDCAAVALSSAI
ncbi:hypothetical protein MMAN_06420 [Mycobacterium mantenii]|nr:hypothetical protein [Mycobacterium mantenii]MCV7242801.1 hypothetical protein [Mycobacterium mantenii]BBY36508.1 hypothetical protein MMAN_06420 [Mycobacterium mantenii]